MYALLIANQDNSVALAISVVDGKLVLMNWLILVLDVGTTADRGLLHQYIYPDYDYPDTVVVCWH